MATSEVRTERSCCRVCTAMCGVLIDVAGDTVVAVHGDRDHPVSHGYMCPKGRALPKMHHDPLRLEYPLVRNGDGLQRATWEHVLGDIGARLRGIIDQHGPSAVGIFFGSGLGMDAAGYRTAEALHAALKTPARFSPITIDGTAKTYVAAVVGGFPGLSPRPDYDSVNLVVYVGVNPMVSHGHNIAMPNPAPTIRAIAERGEVWVIDPLHTETARFATRHLAPRPGTDYAILAWLVRELLQQGASAQVLARHAVDGDKLRAAVADFRRERVVAIAGVAADDLEALLASLSKAGRFAFETGTGVTMAESANVTQWLAWVLMIISDSMNRRGGVWFHPGFVNRLDAAPLPLISEILGPGPKSRPELHSIIGEYPCAALADEINAGNIRALINLGGSLIRSFPDANTLQPALQKLDVLVTLEVVANETTALSTHVLPSKDQLERPDLSMWDFLSGRLDAWYVPAIVKPVGERRASWWIIAEIMRELGLERPAMLPANAAADADGAEDSILAALMVNARCSFAELKQRRHIEQPLEFPARWVDAHIERFGGWRLAPEALVAQLAAQSRVHLDTVGRPFPLSLIPRRQRRHLNAQYLFLGDPADVLMNPGDAAAAGISDGQPVRVRSARGEIVGVARVDAGMRLGVVSVPHGHRHANVNLLTDARAVDGLTGMVQYSGISVSVQALPVASA